MNYIRYHEAEYLFRKHHTLEAILECLSSELKHYSKELDSEYITGSSLGTGQNEIFIQSNKISDKTYSIASSNYADSINTNYLNAKAEIREDITIISMVLDKLNISFRRLSCIQQEILRLYYWDEKTWDEVIDAIKPKRSYISKGQAQRYRKSGIEKIRTICMIDIESYKKVVKLLDK